MRGQGSTVPFIGQIREIEAPASGKSREVNVQVAWFYRPEEAQGGRKARCCYGIAGLKVSVSAKCTRPADPVLHDAAISWRKGALQVGAPGLVPGGHNRG